MTPTTGIQSYERLARVARHLQRRKGFVLEKTRAIIQRVLREGSTVDMAACIDDHIRDDTLNEALIVLSITYQKTFVESFLTGSSVTTLL
jgi:hypothetical protein